MVFFQDGKPKKQGYRHFKIQTVEGADDTGMMYEVLLRRYRRAVEKNDLPDLVLLDGGRGQLNVAQEVFKELKIEEVDLISLAKERPVEGSRFSRLRKTEEKVFHPQYKEPFLLGRHSATLHLLDRIRDEAHRFAITYHKKVRGRETIKSELGEIPGIGQVRQKELLKYFETVEKIRKATEEELTRAPKMNRKTARAVYRFLHPSMLESVAHRRNEVPHALPVSQRNQAE
jgi:excinuclease ABC subunit C